MALTKTEIKQYVTDIVLDDRGWNWTQWDDECHRLSIHIKYDQQLVDLEALYQNKLKRLYQHYQDYYDQLKYGVSESFITATSEDAIADLKNLKDKFTRIALKWNTVKAEIRGRELGQFIRTPVGTTYYIDLDGGNDGADGLGTGTAWLTLAKYTSVTARSAGDIAYVRANTSEVQAVQLNFDEDGTAVARIKIIGCDSVTHDPWTDGSDAKPLYDGNNVGNKCLINADNFWHIERMDFHDGGVANGAHAVFQNSYGHYVKDCIFRDNNAVAGEGARTATYCGVFFDGCTFQDNTQIGLNVMYGSEVVVKSCTFDAGAGAQVYGIQAFQGGRVYIINSTLGVTNAHTTADVYASGGTAYLRNTNTGAAGLATAACGVIYVEDTDQTYGDHYAEGLPGNITKETIIVRVGGGDSSIKMEPSSIVGAALPLTTRCLSIDSFEPLYPFKIWCAAALTTITIYIRSLGAWGTYPTTSELYLEGSYLNHAVNATRTEIASNDVLSDATTWVAFDVTFTPLQAGWVYLNVYLKKYEASKGCYVDVKPVVS